MQRWCGAKAVLAAARQACSGVRERDRENEGYAGQREVFSALRVRGHVGLGESKQARSGESQVGGSRAAGGELGRGV